MSSAPEPKAAPAARAGDPLDPELKRLLVERALEASRRAYIPYSRYPVGAAILVGGRREGAEPGAPSHAALELPDGRLVFTGCNIENASYGLSVCAERCTTFKAVSEGYRDFLAAAIVTRDGGIPCGACRQVLNEYGHAMRMILADMEGKICYEGCLPDLLPHSFGPGNLLG